MTPTAENRQFPRINFYQGLNVRIVAIDGTWSRSCKMIDVSLKGCKLLVENPFEGINERQFFLVFSATDAVRRRCKLIWTDREQLGVRFLTGPAGEIEAQGEKVLVARNQSN